MSPERSVTYVSERTLPYNAQVVRATVSAFLRRDSQAVPGTNFAGIVKWSGPFYDGVENGPYGCFDTSKQGLPCGPGWV